jgi:hypothetical protein
MWQGHADESRNADVPQTVGYLTSKYRAALATSTPLPVRQYAYTPRAPARTENVWQQARASRRSRCPALRSRPRPPAQHTRSWSFPVHWEAPDATTVLGRALMCRSVRGASSGSRHFVRAYGCLRRTVEAERSRRLRWAVLTMTDASRSWFTGHSPNPPLAVIFRCVLPKGL